MNYENLPDILPAGGYHMDEITFSIINRKKRQFVLTKYYGQIRTKTAVTIFLKHIVSLDLTGLQ